jgi:hypothetical protein
MPHLRNSTTTWPQPRARRGIAGVSWLRLAGVALTTLAIAAAALLLAALANRPPVPTAPLAGILATPGSYLGQQVVVNGQVEDLLTHRAFTLEASSSRESLLALVEDSAVETAAGAAADALSGYVPQLHGPLYRTDDPVKLVGTVERFDRATLADQLDMALSPRLFDSFEGQPVLVVEQLDTTDLLGVPSIAAPAAARELGTAAP